MLELGLMTMGALALIHLACEPAALLLRRHGDVIWFTVGIAAFVAALQWIGYAVDVSGHGL